MKFLLMLFALFVSLAQAQELEVNGPKKQLTLQLKELKSKLKTHVVKIDDPFTKKTETYDAFALSDVLNLAGIAGEGQIILTCSDGYAPVMDLSYMKKHHGFIAYQEHGTHGKFTAWREGKSLESPAPFYLVWSEGKKLMNEAPWPARLVKIELVDAQTKLALTLPKNAPPDSPTAKGYAIFKTQCLTCHSINLQGGEVGRELNIPRNVTEYWPGETLKAYIHDASAFHAHSRMPSFRHLSSAEVDQIIAYLTYMKDFKSKQN